MRARVRLCVLLLSTLLLACGPSDNATTERKEAPDFEHVDLEGNSVRLSALRGKTVVIDFWATWCPPCVEEVPMLKELHEIYGEQGLEILAISDESAEVVQTFVEENEVPYPNLIGTDEVSSEYRVLGLPTAYLIDGEGNIVEFFAGPKPRRVLEKKIRELLELEVSSTQTEREPLAL